MSNCYIYNIDGNYKQIECSKQCCHECDIKEDFANNISNSRARSIVAKRIENQKERERAALKMHKSCDIYIEGIQNDTLDTINRIRMAAAFGNDFTNINRVEITLPGYLSMKQKRSFFNYFYYQKNNDVNFKNVINSQVVNSINNNIIDQKDYDTIASKTIEECFNKIKKVAEKTENEINAVKEELKAVARKKRVFKSKYGIPQLLGSYEDLQMAPMVQVEYPPNTISADFNIEEFGRRVQRVGVMRADQSSDKPIYRLNKDHTNRPGPSETETCSNLYNECTTLSSNELTNTSNVRYTNNFGNKNSGSKFCACYNNSNGLPYNSNVLPYNSNNTTNYPHNIMVKNVNTEACKQNDLSEYGSGKTDLSNCSVVSTSGGGSGGNAATIVLGQIGQNYSSAPDRLVKSLGK